MQNQRIAHFVVHERIGEGGMGTVYRAEDTLLGREVALKFVLRSVTGEPGARERFLREARATSALDHPNICTVYEVGETDDGTVFMAMALYRGETLSRRLWRGALPHDQALAYAVQLVSGLERAHSRGILHRDLKPSNVFLTDDGLVKLLDFGLARFVEGSRMTRSGVLVGTAAYLAPELVLGGDGDHRSDLWSAGVVLYEMLAGRLPFSGAREASLLYAIAHDEPEPLRGVRSELPEGLYAIVARCLRKEPAERYPSAEALRRDLELVRRGLPFASPPEPQTEAFGAPRPAGQPPTPRPEASGAPGSGASGPRSRDSDALAWLSVSLDPVAAGLAGSGATPPPGEARPSGGDAAPPPTPATRPREVREASAGREGLGGAPGQPPTAPTEVALRAAGAARRPEPALRALAARLRRHPRWAAAGAVAVVALLATVGWLWSRRAAEPLAPVPRNLAVLPLANRTGDAAYDALARGLGAVLVDQLAAVPGLHVVPRDQAFAAARSNPSAAAAETARELGADAALTGELRREAEVTHVNVRLVDATTGEVRWAREIEQGEDRLLGLQVRLARQLTRDLLGALGSAPAGALAAPARSEEAYRLFLQAEARFDDLEASGDGPLVEGLLRHAIELDSGFALAYARLAQLLVRGHGIERGKPASEEATRLAAKALELAPDLPDAQLAQAEATRALGDYPTAIAALRRLAALHPDLDSAQHQLALAYRKNGQLPEAERTIRQALRRRPEYWGHWNVLGGLLLRQGEYDGAREAYEKAASLTRHEYGSPVENLATLELMLGNFEAALAAYDRLPRPISDAELASNIGSTYFYLGRLDEAEEHYRLALRLRPSEAFHSNLGDVYARRGDVEAARREYGRAADLVARAAAPREWYTKRVLYLAKAGRCDEAREVATAAAEETTLDAPGAASLAKAHAACGSPVEALAMLERALELGYRPEVARGEEEFRGLAGNPRFTRLVGAPATAAGPG